MIVPPPTEVIITAINTAIRVGTSLVLLCSATSLTDNVEITWEHPAVVDGITPTLNNESTNEYYSSVNIDKVTTANDGVYSCAVKNEGGITNATIGISVFGELISFLIYCSMTFRK